MNGLRYFQEYKNDRKHTETHRKYKLLKEQRNKNRKKRK